MALDMFVVALGADETPPYYNRPKHLHHMALNMFVVAQGAVETPPYVIDPTTYIAWYLTCLKLLKLQLISAAGTAHTMQCKDRIHTIGIIIVTNNKYILQ